MNNRSENKEAIRASEKVICSWQEIPELEDAYQTEFQGQNFSHVKVYSSLLSPSLIQSILNDFVKNNYSLPAPDIKEKLQEIRTKAHEFEDIFDCYNYLRDELDTLINSI